MTKRLAVPARALATCCLIVVMPFASPPPASAKILKTKMNRPSRPDSPRQLGLNLGSAFEFETDSEESAYGFPFLLEYGVTKKLKLSVEPSYVLVRRKRGGSIRGPGDVETTLAWECLSERRYRPGVSAVGAVAWPTARRGDLGTGERDYSLGGIVSKEFVGFDVDLNALYTFVGSPPGIQLKDTFEASIATEWHLTTTFDIVAESIVNLGAGGRFRTQSGTLGSFGNIGGPRQGQTEYEFTLGVAEHLSDRFKLEEGLILKSGGSVQTVVAWEWALGEGP